MDVVDAPQLVDGPLVVVDAQVDQRVGVEVAASPLDDEQRRGLLAAPVAAGRLRGGEAREQPSASGSPDDASNVSASASTVSAETRMFPCAA